MAAPKTVATYDLNGSVREFDFPFDYLSRGFVKVTIIGAERRTLTVGTDYTFVSNNRIRTNLIYGPPDWAQIEIRRVTSTTERLVDFQDASILRADDLNLSDLQVLHVAEEAREAATETIGTNNLGHLDARGRRIVNVIDPVDPLDVVNRRWYEADVNGVYQNRVATEQARDKAKEWATKPTQVESGLDSAKTYSERASVSAGSAATSASLSYSWANTLGGSVSGNDYSSKHWSVESKKSADASEASRRASSDSATSSSQSATSSANSAKASRDWAIADGYVPGTSSYSARSHAIEASRLSSVARDWAEKDTAVEPGKFSSKYWAQAAQNGVLPAGAVTWDKLSEDVKNKRFLKLSGGTVDGEVGFTQLTSDNRYSNGLGFYTTSGNSFIIKGPDGFEFRHDLHNPDGIKALLRKGGGAALYGDVTGASGRRLCYVDEMPMMPTAWHAENLQNSVTYRNTSGKYWCVNVVGTTSSQGVLLEVIAADGLTWLALAHQGGVTGVSASAWIPPGGYFRTRVNPYSSQILK